MPTDKKSAIAYIGLGGNIGDPVVAMAEALHAIDARPDCKVLSVSRLYRTPPWGKTDQDWFFNAAAAVETELTPHALLSLCLEIEQSMKRVRIERWGPRTIDIDILAYDDLAVSDDTLTLPHPRMKDRAFVLMPLADLARDLKIEGETVADRLDTAEKTGIAIADQDRQWWLKHVAP